MAIPLADRIRPKTLDDVVGQEHLIAPGKPLRRILETGRIPNLIFYGPSGKNHHCPHSGRPNGHDIT